MMGSRSPAALAALAFFMTGAALAEEPMGSKAIDAEHIFGFTEGTDIGAKGELEFENTMFGAFGRPGGGFGIASNELAARYGLTDEFRASGGFLTDYHNIHGFADIADVSRLDFGGLTSEFRWLAIPRADGPVGLTFSFSPFWRRIDATTAANVHNVSLPLTVLMDRELIPGLFVGAVNATYSPAFSDVPGGWRTEHNVELSVAASYQIFDGAFVGGEVRRDMKYQDLAYPSHALFVGPSLFIRLNDSMSVKAAWSAQIGDFGSGRLSLTDYERHQVLLLLVKNF